jgi:hypothetical protein
MISDEQVERYARDGYLVWRAALSATEVIGYRAAAEELMARWEATGDPYERVLHQRHLPWREDATVARLTTHPKLADASCRLTGMPGTRVFLDQVICKPPGGTATIAHQDAPFLAFDDERSVNCWIALDDVTVANGALAYYRGSHRLGRLPLIHLDSDDDLVTRVPALAGLPVDVVEMVAGDVVFHNCHTVHQAAPNTASRPRIAFSIQYMPSDARYNGYEHDHLTPYRPAVGQVLDFPCFAVPASSGQPR